MVATVEFQISGAKFAAAVLHTLRTTPRCPPGAFGDLQLQRVRYRSASVRADKTGSFRVWQEMGPWDQGLGWEWIEGRIAPLIAQPDVTILLDLACEPAGGGRIALRYELAGVEDPAQSVVGGVSLPQWARDRLSELLDLQPLVIDLSGAIAQGRDFINAGLAADVSSSRLVIRAEVTSSSFSYWRWKDFLDGSTPDRLGPHDWSIFLRAADLNLTLTVPVGQAIRDGLGDEAHRLISLDFAYAPQPGRAVITLTPYVDLPVIGTTAIPVTLTLSTDAAAGRLIVELDAHGIRDVIADAKFLAFIIINLLMPVVGWFVFAALVEAVGGAMKAASSAAGGVLQEELGGLQGAPQGTSFEEVGGQPFRYRATVPVAVPSFVNGAFEALIATPEGIALAGRWRILDLAEGELSIDASEFGWQAPTVACGSSGERVLRDFPENPGKYAHLYAQVSMTYGGTAPARLCAVSPLVPIDASSGLQVTWASSNLPSVVKITAPAAYAGAAPATPLLFEVRTTAGVFHASVPRPAPMTQGDVERMRSLILLQLRACDAIVVPPWFDGDGRFDLSWIVDPLIDPDFEHSWVSLTDITVTGLNDGSRLVLSGSDERPIAFAPADADGSAQLSVALGAGMRGAFASVDVAEATRTAGRERSVSVSRELLEGLGSIRLPAPATAVFAAPSFGWGRFLAALDDRVVLLDATAPTRPVLGRQWPIGGARGAVAASRGTLLFGDAGLFSIDRAGRSEQLDDEVVLDATEIDGNVAMLTRGRLVLVDSVGRRMAEEQVDEEMEVLVRSRQRLRVLSLNRAEAFETTRERRTRRLGPVRDLAVARLARSTVDGRLYGFRQAGESLSFRETGEQLSETASFAGLPWQAGAARSGRLVLHMREAGVLDLYRSTGPREMLPVGAAEPG